MEGKQSRRTFLKGITAAGAGLLVGGKLAPVFAKENKYSSTVINVRNKNAQDAAHKFNAEIIQAMVFEGVRKMSNTRTDTAAWSTYFTPKDVVGIKINCLFGPGASTHAEVVNAVIAGLKLAGVKPDNIIVWDRSDGDLAKNGYEINRDKPGVKYFGTNSDYDTAETQQGSFKGRLSKILTERITALVNVPILKDHGIAGVTISFKNHYGSINNAGSQHGNNCNPFLADLYSVPAIRSKTRLIVCDAIRPLANGGPGLNPSFLWDYNGILVGTDPVALDHSGWQIIEDRRKEIKLPTLAEAGRPVGYLETAAKLGLGTNAPSKIRVVENFKI
jgi:uncharacterized protein (DUF362 family)